MRPRRSFWIRQWLLWWFLFLLLFSLFFFPFSFFFFKGAVLTVIDCADTGVWWNWPWHKLHLSTSYLRPVNISGGRIFARVTECKWSNVVGGGRKKKKRERKRSMSRFCFAAQSQLQVCLEWALTRCCAFTWCNRTASPYFFELGLFMEVYQIFLSLFFYCFVAFPFVLKLSIRHKYTVCG